MVRACHFEDRRTGISCGATSARPSCTGSETSVRYFEILRKYSLSWTRSCCSLAKTGRETWLMIAVESRVGASVRPCAIENRPTAVLLSRRAITNVFVVAVNVPTSWLPATLIPKLRSLRIPRKSTERVGAHPAKNASPTFNTTARVRWPATSAPTPYPRYARLSATRADAVTPKASARDRRRRLMLLVSRLYGTVPSEFRRKVRQSRRSGHTRSGSP